MTSDSTVLVFDPLDLSLSPCEAGEMLADRLLSRAWPTSVDLTACKAAMLIGGFFNATLLRIHTLDPEKLPLARKLQWIVPFEFQRKNIARWTADFTP